MTTRAIINIGKLVTGNIDKPLSEATAIWIEDGCIKGIGHAGEFPLDQADQVIDVQGMAVCPGLIDPHVHNTLDDYAPQQREVGWMENALLVGNTTIISEGEQGPGFPRFLTIPSARKPPRSWRIVYSIVFVPAARSRCTAGRSCS